MTLAVTFDLTDKVFFKLYVDLKFVRNRTACLSFVTFLS